MNSYIAMIRMNLRLALREKVVLFFNYILPLIFFFTFGQIMRAGSGSITRILAMVLTIGILGSGLFGAGIRAVVERETNILRRFKVAPITPLPIQVASMVVGLVLYLPSVALLLFLSMTQYGLAFPTNWPSLVLFIALGAVAFRAIGLIIAAVVNSAAEANIIVQMIWLPMLFLSGATFPITAMPSWLQTVTQFIPASYLLSGMQSLMVNGESLLDNGKSVLALIVTIIVGTLLSVKLFRWEKEEKLPASSKVWLVAVFIPFLLLGTYQAYSKESLDKTKQVELSMRRGRIRLIRNARIFIGDGKVIESGAVLVKNGKIDQIWEGPAPDEKSLRATVIEGAGMTLMPGLIDAHVHLSSPGGIYEKVEDYQSRDLTERELAAYLYSGVVAVKSVGDPLDLSLSLRNQINRGLYSGSELFIRGPMFTAPGGHGTEYAKMLPAAIRDQFLQQIVRLPKSADEAKQQVRDLKTAGVDGIKIILEGGAAGMVFNRLNTNLAQAIAEQAKSSGLPVVVHTGDKNDVADAVRFGATGIEHGSMRDDIDDEVFRTMAQRGIFYDPTLSVGEAFNRVKESKSDLLDRSLVQMVGPQKLLLSTKSFFAGASGKKMAEQVRSYPTDMAKAMENLKRAYAAGVPLVTGTDSGNMLLIHGPALHRELQLYVQAGIPPSAALQAATSHGAKLLGVDQRMGRIAKGLEATLLLVDGNPLQDITATERIREVFLKGELVDRSELFDQK